jgi:hypothetical protein
MKNVVIIACLLFGAFLVAVLGTVGEYDATTGAVVNANFITRLSDPCALASAPSL